ncbi:hypothetical protein CPB97_009034 [Podila verticillata]|nr:hypothetical protein CPB97_009034 [Podila verticillata]
MSTPLYNTVFGQEDATTMHDDIEDFIDLLATPPASPFDESLPGSPESVYSCHSPDESSPCMPVAHTIDNKIYNPDSDSLTSLVDFVMSDELFSCQAVCGSDEGPERLVQFNNSNYNANDRDQKLAHYTHRHYRASISQVMISTTEPYPATSPEPLIVDKSLKAPKIRVSRRSPSVTSNRCNSQSPEPSSTPSSSVISSNSMVIDNDDGSIMLINSETGAATFQCKLCSDISFGRIHDYKRHQVSKHQAVTFSCEFCTKPFARRDALLRHYYVKSSRNDGIHPNETEKLAAARARAKISRA